MRKENGGREGEMGGRKREINNVLFIYFLMCVSILPILTTLNVWLNVHKGQKRG